MKSIYSRMKPLVLALFVASFASCALADDSGLIIPMPGQKQIEKVKKQPEPSKKPTEKNPSGKNGGTLIPLPTSIKHNQNKPVPKPEVEEPKEGDAPLILIRPKPVDEKKPEEVNVDSSFPKIPDEVTVEPGSLAPPEKLPEASSNDAVETDSAAGDMPIFPKDTSSAVFMVMKTWQCKEYDGNTLLTHAVEVYSQEADDKFEIKGLNEKDAFKLDLEEEDITLDELLDLIALKTGRDWGVDIPSKTIYFYPKGVKTESMTSW